LSMLGCADSPDPKCTSMTATCDGSGKNILACENGTQVVVPCTNDTVCQNGKCVNLAVCQNGARQCASDESFQVCSAGEWSSFSCPSGTECQSGTCVFKPGTCTAGESACTSLGKVAECILGQVVVSDCPSGSTCLGKQCTSQQTCSSSEPATCLDSVQVRQCVAGIYEYKPCGLNQECKNGSCIATAQEDECRAGQTKCEGLGLYACQNGRWAASACPTNQACLSGTCVDTCRNIGSVKCEGLDILTCSADLFWIKSTTCATGCQNGVCTTTECTASGFVPYCLNATTLASACSAAGTLTKTTCSNGCQNNACVTTTPECSQAGFAPYCIDASTLASACSASGVLTKTTCPNGCAAGKCQAAPECSQTGFAPYCIDASTLASACSASGVLTKTTCPNGCAAGKCQAAPPVVGSSCSASYTDSCHSNSAYYCDSSNKVARMDCSTWGETCFIMKDGSAECGATSVSDVCSADGDIYFYGDGAGGNAFCQLYTTYGVAVYGTCHLVGGTMYGVESYARSICLGNDRIYCSGSTIQSQTCSGGCSFNTSTAEATCIGGGGTIPTEKTCATADSCSGTTARHCLNGTMKTWDCKEIFGPSATCVVADSDKKAWCVDSGTASFCSKDYEYLGLWKDLEAYSCYWETGYLNHAGCVRSGGRFYLADLYVDSVCLVDADGPFRFMCDGENITYEDCSSSCTSNGWAGMCI